MHVHQVHQRKNVPSFQVIDIWSKAILEAWEIQGAAFGFLLRRRWGFKTMPIHRHKRNEKNLLLIPGTPAPRGSQSVSHFTCGGAQIRPQPLLIALILNRPRWGWVIGLRADRFFAYHHSCRSPVSSLKRKGSAEESTNHGFSVKPLSRTLNRPRGEMGDFSQHHPFFASSSRENQCELLCNRQWQWGYGCSSVDVLDLSGKLRRKKNFHSFRGTISGIL